MLVIDKPAGVAAHPSPGWRGATVIGGVSLAGGRGSYFDVLGGVLLLSIIANALNLTTIDPFWVEPIRGFIILFAVFLDSQRETLRMWLLKHAKS